jgi:hypothetical protein
MQRHPALFVLLLAVGQAAQATETEHLAIAVLPATGKVSVDGKTDDWDLSGGVFACGDVENQRERFAVWVHAMYDDQALYVLARWTDQTPLNNPGQAEGSYGFAGDCLQVRFIFSPNTADERFSHWTCWQDASGKDVMDVEYGKDFKQGKIRDAQTQGAQQEFSKHDDDRGYVQEMALPWKLLTKTGRSPGAGAGFTMTVEPNFTVGGQGRLTIKDIFKPGVTPDRVFTFMASQCWGPATLERKGRIDPRPVRLADARQFPTRLEGGLPVIDWTGLIRRARLKGFLPIRFNMPDDGFVSLHILNRDGQVVRQLLNASPRTKGQYEVFWDGLTTMNWRTPGQPVPPGTYTYRAIWHRGIGLRLRGWACNGGSAPWDSSPTSNWGGDHGVPVDCAAGGDRVLLAWSGAEAGKALLCCDLDGNVLWRNIRQGMAGAEFVAVDGDIVYAANWASEHGNQLYRVRLTDGTYIPWGGDSPDLTLKDLFSGGRDRPNRIDGLAAVGGKLYLSFTSARFRREHVSNWRGLLEQLRKGGGLAGTIWNRVDEGRRQQAEKWLAGNQPEDEGLKAPNYYTPDVRDAVVKVLNDLLKDRGLAGVPGNAPDDEAALAVRRKLEAAFPQMIKLQTGFVAVVDAARRRVLRTYPVPCPRHLAATSDKLVYVVSCGRDLVALDPASGGTRTIVKSLRNATGVAVDAEGLIYVAVRDPENQVKIFSPEGKTVRAIGRRGGRRLIGPWQADGMAFAAGIAVDAKGQLWVAEADSSPKRISVWNAANGAPAKEFFGPTAYGALGGAINPLDPNLMVGHGCEWRIDPQTGRAKCLGTFDRGGMSNARFGIGPGGRLYLAVAPGWIHGSGDISIYERIGDADYKLRSAFRYEGKDQSAKTRLWADENGDSREQANEVTEVAGHVRFSGWYMNFTPDMTIYSEDQQYRLAGLTACGAPKYGLVRPRKMPAKGLGSADGRKLLAAGAYGEEGSWFECYDIGSGKKLWDYPDNFVGVHGSHRACPPTVGMIRGSFGPCGAAKLPGPLGNVWVIATNVGEWHILTEQGFYLAKLFQGDPMKVAWPNEAVPGAVLDNVPPGAGGEDFGGSIACTRDGRLLLQAGKTAFWNVEVVGLDTVKPLPGGQVNVSSGDVAKAEQFRVEYLQAAVGTRKLTVKKATPTFTGDVNRDFTGAQIIEFRKQADAAVRAAAAWDDRNLCLAWDVRDPTPWLNAASVPEQMYTGGDTVDFQLGTDPKADPKRGEAVQGDLRLSIGNFQGQPTAVLYRRVWSQKKPKQFSSGVVKDYRMDYVEVLADARIEVKVRSNHGYVVEAAVPLAALGLKPADGLKLRGDFGATHGGPDGQRTRLRTYWNNQHTGIVDDVVFELKMEPKYWADLEFRR